MVQMKKVGVNFDYCTEGYFMKFIYVLGPLALCMVSIQEQFLIKSGL